MSPRALLAALAVSLAMWAAIIGLALAGWRLTHPARAAEAPAPAVVLLPPEEPVWLAPEEIEALPRTVRIQVTAYACYDAVCRTATGTRGRPGVAAADWRVLPPGTVLEIEGLGRIVIEDRCPACEGREPPVVDVWMPSREQALRWGRRLAAAEGHP